MRRSRRSTDSRTLKRRDEEGSASLEFITAGMLLLLPLVYLVLVMSAIQAGALAVEGASRQAARVFVQAATVEEATARAGRAIEFALADYGIEAGEATVDIRCSPDPVHCLTRRGLVTVDVGISIPLPLVPPVLTVDIPVAVPLEATATQQVSRFWSGR